MIRAKKSVLRVSTANDDDKYEVPGGVIWKFGSYLADTMIGGSDRDFMDAGRGDDWVDGGNGSDVVEGRAGNDTLLGSGGHDTLLGGEGDDLLNGGDNDDVLSGGEGNDWLQGGQGTNRLLAGAGDDLLGGDRLRGVNLFDGDEGIDTLLVTSGGSRAKVDLAAGTVSGGYYGGSTLVRIENVANRSIGDGADLYGDHLSNTLTGNAKADTLDGRGGADILQGGAGDDRLTGGLGQDTLIGGRGNDVFIFRPGEIDGDVLVDFMGNGAKIGDQLRFEGFGDGAYLTGSASQVTIHYERGQETFTLIGSPLHDTDYAYV